jgi:class 3 adenylate cyclase/predicted ATPase
MIEVEGWLAGLGLAQYARAFADNAVDGEVLRTLTDDDLRELGVGPLGHRKRLLAAIAALDRIGAGGAPAPSTRGTSAGKSPGDPASTAGGADADAAREEAPEAVCANGSAPPAADSPEVQRRQLTVMFVDLVGSTQLSARLDPEDMREVLRAYQNAVSGEIARLGGHVAKLMGDGILAYFGWPAAREDAAERAVRAGLAVVAAVAGLRSPTGASLAARIGIATGMVLVGELIGDAEARERAVVGETPNLAARLQAAADPGAVVVAQGTQRLLGRTFVLEALPPLDLKGFETRQQAWRVVSEGGVEGRFDAMHVETMLPLIGRDQELALLLDRWQRAQAGEGQVVVLAGEPGIGKSRIVMALREKVHEAGAAGLRYFCSPQHTGTPFWPFASQFERAMATLPAAADATALERLEALLGQSGPVAAEDVALFADLLSLAPQSVLPRLELSPEERKIRTIRALVDQLEALARRRPVLLILEDAHWIDPTSRETFDLVVDRIQSLPVLCVVTSRPEFDSGWTRLPHVTLLTLNRLGRAHTERIVAELAHGRRLPGALLAQILAKTDGVPLFVEELTKMVLESDLVRAEGDAFVSAAQDAPLAVPDTLRDSLMARLDRFPEAREVAQVAAVLGREFDLDLLSAVADADAPTLDTALDRLLAAELVFRRGASPRRAFGFKHALVQDTAYQSLPRSRRQRLHARTAEALRSRFPERVAAAPELLAHHLTEAGLGEEAVEAWLEAGAHGLTRCAFGETIHNLNRGIAVAMALPPSPRRDRAEISLRNALGQAMHSSFGPTPEVEASFRRARELCAGTGDEREWMRASYGLWFCRNWRMEHREAQRSADELLARIATSEDSALVLQAHHAAWTTAWQLGQPAQAVEHAQLGRALYDPARHHVFTAIYGGHDAGVCCRNTLGLTRTFLGFVDQGAADAAEGEALARQVAHPFSRALSLFFRTNIHLLRGEVEVTSRLSHEMADVCARLGIRVYGLVSRVLTGWTLAAAPEDRDRGIAMMREGLEELKRIGARARRTEYLGLFAERSLAAGDTAACDAALAEARSLAEETGERFFLAELHRIAGASALASGAGAVGDAEHALGAALAVARDQGARLFELRATVDLAALLAQQGERARAHDLLAPVYGWFTEGLDTPRLAEASSLLEALS